MPRNNRRPRRTQPVRPATAWTEATPTTAYNRAIRSFRDVEFTVNDPGPTPGLEFIPPPLAPPPPPNTNGILCETTVEGGHVVYIDIETTGDGRVHRHGSYRTRSAAELAATMRQADPWMYSEMQSRVAAAQPPASAHPSWAVPRAMRVGTERHRRMEAELALQASDSRVEAVEVAPPRPAGLFARGQAGINKSQIRDMMAHRNVWDHTPAGLRTRLNASLSSESRLFRLSRSECDYIRAALQHGRGNGLTPRLNGLLMAVYRWS